MTFELFLVYDFNSQVVQFQDCCSLRILMFVTLVSSYWLVELDANSIISDWPVIPPLERQINEINANYGARFVWIKYGVNIWLIINNTLEIWHIKKSLLHYAHGGCLGHFLICTGKFPCAKCTMYLSYCRHRKMSVFQWIS